MGVRVFGGDDDGYLAWLDNHPDGYVVNVARSYNAAGARLHHAGCRTISGEIPRGRGWTGPYIKVCAEHVTELEEWADSQVGRPITSCGTCQPARHAVAPASTEPNAPVPMRPLSDGHFTVNGPVAGRAAVEAWADDYIRFQDRPPWQEDLRNQIRSGCEKLAPAPGQVLHATFFGSKRSKADVENLVLYNIGSFKAAGRNGIRFEHGAAGPPSAPDGGEYPFCYRYALAPRSEGFAHWQAGRTLASFDWTDLGALAGEKKLGPVWLALKRSLVTVAEAPWRPGTPFGVRVLIRPPLGHPPVWGNLVKGIFDGVICASHAHTDTTDLPEIVKRLAAELSADATEIEALLRDQHKAVLGVMPRLVTVHSAGVAWHPADHLCVAGELLPAQPAGRSYAIKGELVEVSPLPRRTRSGQPAM